MSILKTLGPTKASDIQFTFDNYRLIFDNKSIEGQLYNIPPYMLNTVVYSVVATMLIIILGSLAAYVISRKEFKGKNLMDALVTLPIALPGIVLAIGYYRAFDWSSIAARNPTWINRVMANLTANLRLDPFIGVAVTLLILSYTVRKFPFTVRSAFAGLQQTDVVLEEASFNLGASRIQTFSKVTLPLISLNVFAGSLVSFLYCLSEVSTTIFLIFQQEAGTLTWYMAWMPLRFQIFCALGVLLMLLQVFSLFVTNVILGSRAEAITGI
jgi:ABC-type Fe3+ transport system permease subunit